MLDGDDSVVLAVDQQQGTVDLVGQQGGRQGVQRPVIEPRGAHEAIPVADGLVVLLAQPPDLLLDHAPQIRNPVDGHAAAIDRLV
ncbi:hypothetical protein D3C85_1652440 [compost metagenome]